MDLGKYKSVMHLQDQLSSHVLVIQQALTDVLEAMQEINAVLLEGLEEKDEDTSNGSSEQQFDAGRKPDIPGRELC